MMTWWTKVEERQRGTGWKENGDLLAHLTSWDWFTEY